MLIATEDVLAQVRRNGYFVTRMSMASADAVPFILRIGRSLGDLYVPKGCPPSEPVIRTAPSRTRRAAPFDRSEAIGWHGDFASYEDRPELSLVYIMRADSRGGNFGAWRLASVTQTLGSLRARADGRMAFDLLSQEVLPFSYSDTEASRWFRVIEVRPGGSHGLRFYLPSLRRGCIKEYGEVPPHINAALVALEHAADEVGEVIPTQKGSLLVASNWFALHDRVRQTVSHNRPNREALLCFVARQVTGNIDGLHQSIKR